jgi:hypothetical protein
MLLVETRSLIAARASTARARYVRSMLSVRTRTRKPGLASHSSPISSAPSPSGRERLKKAAGTPLYCRRISPSQTYSAGPVMYTGSLSPSQETSTVPPSISTEIGVSARPV